MEEELIASKKLDFLSSVQWFIGSMWGRRRSVLGDKPVTEKHYPFLYIIVSIYQLPFPSFSSKASF